MSDFKPEKPVKTYKCILSKDETLLIQKIRSIKFGSVKVHMVGGNIARTETMDSELTRDRQKETITIAVETIIGG